MTDLRFQMLPRGASALESAQTQFKKTLFRIEIGQEVTANVRKQTLMEQLYEVTEERSHHNEEKAMAAAGRRGNQELELIKKLDETIDEIQKEIQENEKQLSDEMKSNAYDLKVNTGKKIVYG